MVNAMFTMLSYPQQMSAYLHRKIIASLMLIALAFGGWYATSEYLLDEYEQQLKVQKNKFRSPEISSDIVVVGLDLKSYKAHSQYPWPRSHHAKIVDNLNSYGVDRIFFDIYFTKLSTPAEDMALENSLLKSSAEIFMPIQFIGKDDGTYEGVGSHPRFLKNANERAIDIWNNYNGEGFLVPYRLELPKDIDTKSISAEAARIDDDVRGLFPLDYAYDWKKVPTYSAIDVLNGEISPEKLAGKTILYGYFTKEFGDTKKEPRGGTMPGLAHHAIASNQLLQGQPTVVEMQIPIALLALFCLCLIWFVRPRTAMMIAISAIPIFFAASTIADSYAIFVDAIPLLALVVFVAGYQFLAGFLEKFDASRRTHRESGLPNLQAFTEDRRNHKESAVIAINFDGYDLVRRSLSNNQLHNLLSQIKTRLSVISNDIYQGTDGSLYFIMQTLEEKDIIESLQGLKMFFVNPIAIDGHMIALKPAFGYDIEPTHVLTERSNHALVASCHAQLSDQKIARFDSILLDEEKQHLSMQSTIKRAMEQNELEVYIQPQIDLDTGWTNSGEALIRWNDPLRGVIAPGEFMPIMEKTPLISTLTLHILQLSIDALSEILPLADDFKVSVNMPPSLMTDGSFIDSAFHLISEADIPNSAIVIEITERGMLFDKDVAKKSMERFVSAGIEFSIDDFGTANSNIEILRSIPASELKIDQSFIKELRDSPKDRALVESIINMAHGLDYKVVAEGVETKEILDLLTNLRCDKAQGYHIAKPLKVKDFTGHLIREFLHKRVLHRSKYG